jgi:hypothetical protein
LTAIFLLVAGSAFAQVRFWWWGRAQVTPYDRSIDPNSPHPHPDGSIGAQIWWTRFGVAGANGSQTIGFDAEVDAMLTDDSTAEGTTIFSSWTGTGNFDSYSLWMKPVDFLFVRVGKYNYDRDTSWALDFFDRTRFTDGNGLAEDEFFTGYDNTTQSVISESTLIPGTPAWTAATGIPAGALLEGYFGPFTVDLNFKGIDSSMAPLDYLQTIQVGVRYEAPGIGFFRAQMIGFDPDGKITGNYNKRDGATSQFQAAANINAIPGFEFRLGFHYYLSKSDTMWGSRFTAGKGAIAIPFGAEVTLFTPLSFRVVGDVQFGKDAAYGKNIYTIKMGGHVKYIFNTYITGLFNVSAYNIGKHINGVVYEDKKPRYDFGGGVQLNNIQGASIQAGVALQCPTHPDAQIGIAVPICFDFGF